MRTIGVNEDRHQQALYHASAPALRSFRIVILQPTSAGNLCNQRTETIGAARTSPSRCFRSDALRRGRLPDPGNRTSAFVESCTDAMSRRFKVDAIQMREFSAGRLRRTAQFRRETDPNCGLPQSRLLRLEFGDGRGQFKSNSPDDVK